MNRADAIIVAAGAGERLGGGVPKAFALLAGEPLLVHAVRSFAACRDVGGIAVVVAAADVDRARRALSAAGLDPHAVGPGGVTRAESVRAGLRICARGAPLVAVHDAARPLVTPDLIARVIAAVDGDWDAAAPGLPIVDTLKLVESGAQEVVRTVDRRDLWAVQTPQVFVRSLLEAAHARLEGEEATDDLSLVERAGGRVRLVDGERRNLKITHPEDLAVAAALAAADRDAGGAR